MDKAVGLSIGLSFGAKGILFIFFLLTWSNLCLILERRPTQFLWANSLSLVSPSWSPLCRFWWLLQPEYCGPISSILSVFSLKITPGLQVCTTHTQNTLDGWGNNETLPSSGLHCCVMWCSECHCNFICQSLKKIKLYLLPHCFRDVKDN